MIKIALLRVYARRGFFSVRVHLLKKKKFARALEKINVMKYYGEVGRLPILPCLEGINYLSLSHFQGDSCCKLY